MLLSLRSLVALSFPLLTSCMSFNNVDLDPFDKDKPAEELSIWSDYGSKNKIYILPVEGTLVSANSAREAASPNDVGPRQIEKDLSKIAEDPDAVGVILQINSPGGSAAGSEDVYKLIEVFKRKEKLPVVAYVAELAASGGYYVAQAADYVVTNPNAIVGSIGVISVFVSVEDLLKKKLDIQPVVVKSGKFKDVGSPLRNMTKEEIAYWHSLTMNYYGHFVEVVAKGRKMAVEDVKPLADGRVYHPEAALKYRLIDKIGSFEDALNRVKELAGVKTAKVVRNESRSRFGGLFGFSAPVHPFEAAEKVLLKDGLRNRILYYADGF